MGGEARTELRPTVLSPTVTTTRRSFSINAEFEREIYAEVVAGGCRNVVQLFFRFDGGVHFMPFDVTVHNFFVRACAHRFGNPRQ